ncbi:hypothetical protein HHL19_00245 [Streptomyces sp. R302]|uniref:hypothetical protein n=1 Tax=unclassified Streptomyces TaxID=2593676 RepID=UPI00145DB63B|nr:MULTISPECIES: hypothetical protein [unclassified Streptomyces]NML48804.1 hypothetical protein [Streptomyces sp. R301]NML77131.1 hypothetical protein [Streptomyces sp. R302]
MAWDEWEQLKGEAAERQSAQMRLNEADGGAGAHSGAGGAGVLGSVPAKKKKAANTIETVLEPGTRKAADVADEPTTSAVRAFTGWDTAVGLKKSHEKWDDQVKRLMGRLSSHKVGLRSAVTTLTGTDATAGLTVHSVKSGLSGLDR